MGCTGIIYHTTSLLQVRAAGAVLAVVLCRLALAAPRLARASRRHQLRAHAGSSSSRERGQPWREAPRRVAPPPARPPDARGAPPACLPSHPTQVGLAIGIAVIVAVYLTDVSVDLANLETYRREGA